ncbi:nitronate monooxygenase, partial [Microbacteriaceae bacterium K1510]|nr:nitronate monooxygenase [Microbacteriaceae bacterium K1510]
FCETFNVEQPIVGAGMAGNITSPELVAAVSEAGGLGTLGGAYMKPDALRQAIRKIKELTDRPYSVNLLLYNQPKTAVVTPQLVAWINEMREAVGLEPWSGELPSFGDDLEECFAVVLEEKPPIFSFAFSLPGRYGEAARMAGMKLIGTATSVEEAHLLKKAGVDAIVAQGGEAGGHRGTFEVGAAGDGNVVGTMPLVPLIVDALPDMPIIAAGGIMNGRGLVAALTLGADAVQLGTRFLASRESMANPIYKARVLAAKETDTTVTRAFSGRPARGIRNQLIDSAWMNQLATLPYPIQNHLTREIRTAAAQRGDSEYFTMWAGQSVAAVQTEETAGEIMDKLMAEAELAIQRIHTLLI